MYSYQTQVIFSEHKLLLRYKARDEDATKFDYIIFDEWEGPRPGAQVPGPRVSQNNYGRIATPVLDRSAISESSRSIILTKVVSDLGTEEIKTKLKDEHFAQVAGTIERIESRAKGIFIIICDSWKSCRNLVNKYNNPKFNEQIPEFALFTETDPAIRPKN